MVDNVADFDDNFANAGAGLGGPDFEVSEEFNMVFNES